MLIIDGYLYRISDEICFTVAKVAKEKIQPLVRKMDAESHMDQSVIKALFENGVRLIKNVQCTYYIILLNVKKKN